jgi:hypothetical protein
MDTFAETCKNRRGNDTSVEQVNLFDSPVLVAGIMDTGQHLQEPSLP